MSKGRGRSHDGAEGEPVFPMEMATKSELEMCVFISCRDSWKLEVVTCFTLHFEEEDVQRERLRNSNTQAIT